MDSVVTSNSDAIAVRRRRGRDLEHGERAGCWVGSRGRDILTRARAEAVAESAGHAEWLGRLVAGGRRVYVIGCT